MRNTSLKLTIELLTLILIGIFMSCNPSSDKQEENSAVTASLSRDSGALEMTSQIEKDSIRVSDSLTILDETYFVHYYSNDDFYIINQMNDTLFADNDYWLHFEFVDFNDDGFMDIWFHYMSNVPGVDDLVLYDSKDKTFKKVAGFIEFPDPNKLGNTKYYYSYHRSGCADMNWDSDLFYIDNFKTVRIGNIAGRECQDRDEKDGVYIHKVKGEKEILFQTLPIDTIWTYEDMKWGFIKDYWTKNYTKFTK